MQNGALAEAIGIWKRNFDKEFEGVEECPICYSVIHTANNSLPRLACKTCKHKFHSACLYKWFSTSHKSTCPLCQSPFWSGSISQMSVFHRSCNPSCTSMQERSRSMKLKSRTVNMQNSKINAKLMFDFIEVTKKMVVKTRTISLDCGISKVQKSAISASPWLKWNSLLGEHGMDVWELSQPLYK